ncbi:MAG: hypothetical protein ACREUP_09500, partial [Burkholderiales bacterium]
MTRCAGITRRDFLGGAAALGAWSLAGCAGLAAGGGSGRLPERGEFVIRNAYVMTMEPGVGDLTDADVLVRNGAIVAVGAGLAAPGAQVIDGRGMIVLPGLIDTHNHLWNTTCRSTVMEGPQKVYFPTVLALGKQ